VERDGAWHHLAVTWEVANNGMTRIYLDGLLSWVPRCSASSASPEFNDVSCAVKLSITGFIQLMTGFFTDPMA
jgi:hypothetical protein